MRKGFLKIVSALSIPLLLVAVAINSVQLYKQLNKNELNPKEKEVITFDRIGVAECNTKYTKEELDFVYAVFVRFWNTEFEEGVPNLRNSFEKICIEYGKEPKIVKNIFNIDGKFIEKGEIIGITHSEKHIWVYSPDEMKRISESSLVHELMHVTLILQGTDGDADHEGKDIDEGWTKKHTDFVEMINVFLWMTGI